MFSRRVPFAAIAALLPVAAHAQDGPAVTVSGEVAVVSDYRFRGMSLTDQKPAVQAGVTVSHEAGFFANVWGSNLSDTPLYGKVELDFSGGWSHPVGKSGTFDAGFGYFTYPDGDPKAGKAAYGEFCVHYAQVVGPVTATAGLGYAPKQAALGDRDSFYMSGDLRGDVPGIPVSLNAHLGRTHGALAPDGNYADWSLGATVTAGKAQFGLSYIDTDISGFEPAKAGLVGTAKITF